jgi:hypothetical protein
MDIKPGTKVRFKPGTLAAIRYGIGVVKCWKFPHPSADRSHNGFWSINFDRVDTGNEENLWFTPDEFEEQLIIVDESQQMKNQPNMTFTLIQTYPDTSQMTTQYQSLEKLLVFLLSNADRTLLEKTWSTLIPDALFKITDEFEIAPETNANDGLSHEVESTASNPKTIYAVLGWDINTQQCETLSGVYDSIEGAQVAAKEASNEHIYQHFQAISIQLNVDIDLDISSDF